MNFWNFSFSYILKGYWNRGEKQTGHIYALCILTLLPTINALSLFFVAATSVYLKSENFKVIVICIFALLLGLNSYLFLIKKNI